MQGEIANFLHNDQIFGASGEVFDAILQENAAVLDPDTEFAGQIDAGLGGSNSAHRHTFGIAAVGAGAFVNLQA